MLRKRESGVALFLTVVTMMVVFTLGYIVMKFMVSQSQFTYHQVARMKAFYATRAGLVLAMQEMRAGSWSCGLPLTGGNRYYIATSGSNDIIHVVDPTMPYGVTIVITCGVPPGTPDTISATVTDYTTNP